MRPIGFLEDRRKKGRFGRLYEKSDIAIEQEFKRETGRFE